MLDKPAQVRVMCLHAGGSLREIPHEGLVGPEGFDHRCEVRIRQRAEEFFHPLQALRCFAARLRMEVCGIDAFLRNGFDARHDHLQAALIELHLAFDVHEVTGVVVRGPLLGHVPLHADHRAGLIAQHRQQIEIRVAIRAERLLGEQEDLIDGIAVFVFVEKLPWHW